MTIWINSPCEQEHHLVWAKTHNQGIFWYLPSITIHWEMFSSQNKSTWTSHMIMDSHCQFLLLDFGPLFLPYFVKNSPGTMAMFAEETAKVFPPPLCLSLVSFRKFSPFHSRECSKSSWRDSWTTESPVCSCQYDMSTDFELSWSQKPDASDAAPKPHPKESPGSTADFFSNTYSLLNHTHLPSCDPSLWFLSLISIFMTSHLKSPSFSIFMQCLWTASPGRSVRY